jgi:hypothetical protein
VKNLFRFDGNPMSNPKGGAPRLIPTGSSGLFAGLSQNFLKLDSLFNNVEGIIDVINDFHWTSSPKSSRQDVPSVILKEKRLTTNSLAAQLAYYGLSTTGKAGEATGTIANLLSKAVGSSAIGNAFTSFTGNVLTGLGQKVLGAASQFGGSGLVSGISQLLTGKSPQQFLNQFVGTSVSTGVLAPYDGLYLTEETKFVYRLPYFEDAANVISNSFTQSNPTQGLISAVGKKLEGMAETAAYTMAEVSRGIDAPGIYIEKAKFYQFDGGATANNITITFPLINTGWATFDDVQRNWQLIYMLVYQNRANRKSRELIDPPCLYEVMIPGVKFMPYAFISALKVDFKGSRRSYYINVPNANGGTSKIQTIIPEAYLVSMTLTCLVSETQNFLYHMLFEKQDIVNVSTITSQTQNGNNFVNNFVQGFKEGFSL